MQTLLQGNAAVSKGRQSSLAHGMPRATAWLLGGLGMMSVLVGMAMEIHDPGWLVLAAFGLILLGGIYLNRQLDAIRRDGVGMVHRWRVRVADVVDRSNLAGASAGVSMEQTRCSTLMWLAGGLWSALTLITAVAAVVWGDTAGLVAVTIGGAAVVVVELAASWMLRHWTSPS